MIRKLTSAIIILAVILSFTACLSEEKELKAAMKTEIDSNPAYVFYQTLSDEEKEAYVDFCFAAENYNTGKFYIGSYSTDNEREAALDRLTYIYKYLTYEQGQYFWIHPSSFTYYTSVSFNRYMLYASINFTVNEAELDEMKLKFDNELNLLLHGASLRDNTFEQVLYVYDSILSSVTYDDVLAEKDDEFNTVNRSAYGALVTHETVCSGYSNAFSLALTRLGYKNGVEFSGLENDDEDDGHVWNYAELDGEYYYFDPTWDDTIFDTEEFGDTISYSHTYFGIDTEELEKTHDREYAPHIPQCDGTEYNYFVYKGYNLDEYSFDKAWVILKTQEYDGYSAIRLGSEQAMLEAKDSLLENDRIFRIYTSLRNIRYVETESGHHLYFFFGNTEE